MMKFALFLGCNIPARVQQYDLSARAVLAKLHVELTDIRQFACCGYPMRNTDQKTALLFSARNLALAQAEELDVLTFCQCCFGTLKKAAHLLASDRGLRDDVNAFLEKENLRYDGNTEVRHLLSLLHTDIGESAIKDALQSSFKDLKIAAHYGCHALRPSDIMQFDDPVAPSIVDKLVTLTGAKSVEWSQKLECCGAPVTGVNDDLAMRLTGAKLSNAKNAGADYICVACPWCQLQFDVVQKQMEAEGRSDADLPSILFPQLLGLAMGIPGEELGLALNKKDISGINDFIVE
jgi:heterodisulfide reductase subunit B2